MDGGRGGWGVAGSKDIEHNVIVYIICLSRRSSVE